jgi:hypothetical protein
LGLRDYIGLWPLYSFFIPSRAALGCMKRLERRIFDIAAAMTKQGIVGRLVSEVNSGCYFAILIYYTHLSGRD